MFVASAITCVMNRLEPRGIMKRCSLKTHQMDPAPCLHERWFPPWSAFIFTGSKSENCPACCVVVVVVVAAPPGRRPHGARARRPRSAQGAPGEARRTRRPASTSVTRAALANSWGNLGQQATLQHGTDTSSTPDTVYTATQARHTVVFVRVEVFE